MTPFKSPPAVFVGFGGPGRRNSFQFLPLSAIDEYKKVSCSNAAPPPLFCRSAIVASSVEDRMKCFADFTEWYRRRGQERPGSVAAPVAPARPGLPSGTEELSLAGGGDRTSAPSTLVSGGREKETFSFQDLVTITENFNDANCLGEGGFGKVFKGRLGTGELVAVKKLNNQGNQGLDEFFTEFLMLIVLDHPNLVRLVGVCTEEDQRLLVYEYMSQGSLASHIHDLPPGREPLKWELRVKVAVGAARGLCHLHHFAAPRVIHRDMKSDNILLDDDFNAKVCDFGMAKFGPAGDATHITTRVMGTYGYCAPEYAMTGKLTTKSDVFGFGVVLLELITGRKAVDPYLPNKRERVLVPWAKPHLNSGRFSEIVDPALRGEYPARALSQMATIAMTMLHEDARDRPTMLEVVAALELVPSASDVAGDAGEASSSASTSGG